MKKLLVSVLIISTVACAGHIFAQEIKGPKIVINEMQHDFGKVPHGTLVDYVFEVRNAGNEPLIIEKAVPS